MDAVIEPKRPFTLRCKWKSGVIVIKDICDKTTLTELSSQISCRTNVPQTQLKIMLGFPPKKVETSDANATLCQLNIKSGDLLTLDIKDQCDEVKLPLKKSPGILMRRTVPADNSCLFTSINYVITGTLNPTSARPLRKLIAEKVSTDPKNYNEGFLGKPNREYCKWILEDGVWGGAIEISLLSQHFGVEIVVVNTQSGSLNRFGEDRDYDRRVFLLYDGIHYDPLVLEVSHPYLAEKTVFGSEDLPVMTMALEIAQEARSSRQFTNLRDFTLRCLQCDEPLKGQVQAQQHARDTGHVNFGEV